MSHEAALELLLLTYHLLVVVNLLAHQLRDLLAPRKLENAFVVPALSARGLYKHVRRILQGHQLTLPVERVEVFLLHALVALRALQIVEPLTTVGVVGVDNLLLLRLPASEGGGTVTLILTVSIIVN